MGNLTDPFDLDNSFWTRGDLNEFISQLEDEPFIKELPEFVIRGSFIEKDHKKERIEIDISYRDYEETIMIPIDMKKIKSPSDLFKTYIESTKEAILQKTMQIDAEYDLCR